MLISHTTQGRCTVVQLAGHLDVSAAAQVRRTLLKAMTAQPAAVVADLGDVTSIDPACAVIFPAAWREAGGWPGVSLSLCRPSPRVKARLVGEGITRFVPLHNDVDKAIDAATALPPYISETTELSFTWQAPGVARAWAGSTARDWGLDYAVDDVHLMVSELVGNVVQHGAAPLRLTLRLRNGLLRIAVEDAGARRPHPSLHSVPHDGVVHGVLLNELGRGLKLVQAVSIAWGVTDAPVGPGKTVWCELLVDPPAQC